MSEDIPPLPNGDSSRVTNWQLYQKLEQLERNTEGLAADLRSQIQGVRLSIEGEYGLNNQVKDHEQRLRATERWKNALPASTLIFMASTAIALIALFIQR